VILRNEFIVTVLFVSCKVMLYMSKMIVKTRNFEFQGGRESKHSTWMQVNKPHIANVSEIKRKWVKILGELIVFVFTC